MSASGPSRPGAPGPGDSSDSSSFSMVSWNCFGAAQTLLAVLRGRGAEAAHRFDHPELYSSLAEVDVLCVQELWLEEAVRAFTKADHLAHRVLAENRWTLWPLTIGGSGLGVASRYPVLLSEFRSYSRPHVGSERFARKGMAHVRVALPSGLEVDFLTTHLQSGYERNAEVVRARHLAELRQFAEDVGSDDRPMVVAGDLNVNGLSHVRDLEYKTFSSIFSGYHDVFADDDHVTFHPKQNRLAAKFEPYASLQRVDYVLVRDRGRTLEVVKKALFLDRDMPAHGGFETVPPSDHYALKVELKPK